VRLKLNSHRNNFKIRLQPKDQIACSTAAAGAAGAGTALLLLLLLQGWDSSPLPSLTRSTVRPLMPAAAPAALTPLLHLLEFSSVAVRLPQPALLPLLLASAW